MNSIMKIFIAFLITSSAVIHIVTSEISFPASPLGIVTRSRRRRGRAGSVGAFLGLLAGLGLLLIWHGLTRATVRSHGPGSARPARASTSSRPGCRRCRRLS